MYYYNKFFSSKVTLTNQTLGTAATGVGARKPKPLGSSSSSTPNLVIHFLFRSYVYYILYNVEQSKNEGILTKNNFMFK